IAAWPRAFKTVTEEATRPESSLGNRRRRLEHMARQFGVQLEILADATTVGSLIGGSSATDDAVAAARCAPALRSALPGIPIALATGSGGVADGFPVGDVVDRAARLLHEASAAIRTDDTMAALLQGRFDFDGGSGAFELRRERDAIEVVRTLLGKPSP